MNKTNLVLLVAVLGFTACKNGAQKVEPQQLESDSSTLVVSDHPITDMLYAELDSSEVYNDSILYGYWFKPHEACNVNIFFHKDDTYESFWPLSIILQKVGRMDRITFIAHVHYYIN